MIISPIAVFKTISIKLSKIVQIQGLIAGTCIIAVAVISIAITLQGWQSRITAFDILPYIYGVRNFLLTGNLPQFGDIGSYGSYSPPGTAWLILPGAILFKDPRLSEYFGAALLHVSTIIGVYLLARGYFGTRCATLAVLLYGLGESALFYAGSLWPIGRPDFYIWIVYLTSRWVVRRDSRYLAAALAVWGFGMYVDMAILPVFFIFPAIWLYYHPPLRIRPLLVSGVIILLVWSPYLRFEISRSFADLRSQLFLQPIFPNNFRVSWCDPGLLFQQFQDAPGISQTIASSNDHIGFLVALLSQGRAAMDNILTNFVPDAPIPGASYLLLLMTLTSLLILSVSGFLSDRNILTSPPPFWRKWFPRIALFVIFSGLLIVGFVYVYLSIFRNATPPGPKTSLILKLTAILVFGGISFLAGPWLTARTNGLLNKMRVNIQPVEEVKQIRLLVFSLLIPWSILLLVAEPGKPERFIWLWSMQSIFLAAFLTNVLPRFKLPRTVIWSTMIVVVLIVVANPFLFTRLDAWHANGWAGPEADESKVADYLAHQLNTEGKDQAAIGYRIFFYPFMVNYNIFTPIYKVGAEIDLLLLYQHGIMNTNQCAEGISASDEYRIVQTKPDPQADAPKMYFTLPSDGQFHLMYQSGSYQVYKRD
jgi:Dolichyl-phosphate-mannose-protein mannosyltransferase